MNKNSLEILEFFKIRDELKNYAQTSLGQEIISKLTPVPNLDYVQARLKEVTVAKELILEYGRAPFGGIRDLRQIIVKVKKGIVLSIKELVDVKNTLSGFRTLKLYMKEIVNDLDERVIENRYHLITKKGLALADLQDLVQKIDNCIDEYDDIKNTASNKLNSLRKEMAGTINKIRDRMEAIIRSKKYQHMLQDTVVSKRRGRFVVPIKHEYRNNFAGIVHDQSASALTLFMEPMDVVKLNNNLSELKRQEEAEIYRILQKLSLEVQAQVEPIKNSLKLTAVLDVIFARAAYSKTIGGIAPEINSQGIVNIKQGRHPLLNTKPVPIDLQVGDKFTNLIITGPNTGGKTVALKTIGLFVLMVEVGLHIPAARGTDIAIFQEVFADIGDEQSIEQNLSTFSSHITKIKSFLEKAQKGSLVLLDELGAGTDPAEGAALGIAILEHLRSKGVRTVATTHYSQLKKYAYSNTGVENASVEFDLETLKPSFRIIMGVPGGSNAFAIALKLGMSQKIISSAKSLLTGEEIKIEDIINELNKERKKFKELKESSAVKEKEAHELREKYQNLIADFKKRKESIVQEASQQGKDIIKQAKKEAKEILKELKRQDFSSRAQIDRTHNIVNKSLNGLSDDINEKTTVKEVKKINKNIGLGDIVRLKSVGRKGQVVDINEEKNELKVQAGVIELTAAREDLVKVEMPVKKREELVKNYQVKKSKVVSTKLDLRGDRYETAQRKLDKYLDDVFLAGLKEIEIIHGKGTGVLREAVETVLKENPHISSYRLGRQEEGGSGVTIVSLN